MGCSDAYDVRLIDAPGPVGLTHLPSDPLLQNGGIVQNPARDCRMINRQPAFRHHLLEIAIAKWVPEIPAHAQYDYFFSKMTASKQRRSALAHPLHPIKAATGRFATLPTIDPTVLRYDSFDGDDITVGVVNNVQSGTAPFLVTRLDLTSTNPFGDFSGPNIFGFDSDGICDVSPKISVGCPFSGVGPAGSISNGYSGAGVTFTALTLNSGTVFFNGGGIGQGRTGYFGLEDVPRGGGDTPEPATSLLIGSGVVLVTIGHRKRILSRP